ncbi:MAG: DUF421 domain-containing protein [Holophaga sp.]|nr:DUF421 domain-containing protein [Holophaga sp.]
MIALLDGRLPVGLSLWHMAQPWWEFVLRGVLIYGFLLVAFRLTGKRQVGQLAPFDLVLLLVVSNAVQNSMNAGDNSVSAGLILVTTLVGLNAGLGWLSFRSKKAESLLEGVPVILIHNGKVMEPVLKTEHITRHELLSALRQEGLSETSQVHLALLETNGHITVIPRVEAKS